MENISRKEFWLGIVAAILALAVAVFFEPNIKDGMLKELQAYQQALQVNGDSKTFTYAQKTNVGNVLAYGNFNAQQPQTIPEIKGEWAFIEKVKEHYTMHTREVCQTVNKQQQCHTEIYYEWDTVQRWTWASQEWEFLGVIFPAANLAIPGGGRLLLNDQTMNPQYAGFYDQWHLYTEQFFGRPSGDDRFYFNVLPLQFVGTTFVRFKDGKVTEPISGSQQLNIWTDMKPAAVIEQKKLDMIVFDIGYYILAVLVVLFGWYWLSYSKLDIE